MKDGDGAPSDLFAPVLLTFSVPGAPTGMRRPRLTVRGGHAASYNDDKAAARRNEIIAAAMQKRARLIDGPLEVCIIANTPVPGSWTKTRKAAAWGAFDTRKPDADNIAKEILDALNGIAFVDDATVAQLTVIKRHVSEGQKPRTIVTIRRTP